jgi:predicted MFS family arabinose efflux permease
MQAFLRFDWHCLMSTIHTAHTQETTLPPALPLPLVGLFAAGAGLAVAALYYSQPMLGELGADIGASPRQIGLVPTLTQLGYAAGIFFLAPLGDRFDRRRIILIKAAALCVALLAGGASSSIALLLVASLAVGLAATMAQDIVPAAATLAPEAQRGRIVGTVMTGLLMGILLSRVVSGFVAAHFGWRTMFVAAAVSIALFAAVAWRTLPRFKATTHLPYGALLASSAQLWKRHGALRRATLAQALLAVGFSAFWSTLAVMLHASAWHLGSAAAGAFGLAGAAGALAAPVAGRLADTRGPELVTRLGTSLAAASFLAMAAGGLLPLHLQLWVIGLGAVGFDLGVQATLISHQAIVYGIDPGARSRLNALLFTGMFIGMSTGAALGSMALAQWGWPGVMLLSAGGAVSALIVRLWPSSKPA